MSFLYGRSEVLMTLVWVVLKKVLETDIESKYVEWENAA